MPPLPETGGDKQFDGGDDKTAGGENRNRDGSPSAPKRNYLAEFRAKMNQVSSSVSSPAPNLVPKEEIKQDVKENKYLTSLRNEQKRAFEDRDSKPDVKPYEPDSKKPKTAEESKIEKLKAMNPYITNPKML